MTPPPSWLAVTMLVVVGVGIVILMAFGVVYLWEAFF